MYTIKVTYNVHNEIIIIVILINNTLTITKQQTITTVNYTANYTVNYT